MKYLLYIPSPVKKMELQIDENEYSELEKAKEFLHFIVTHEESYDILISNYVEFEQEILQLTLENMMFRDSGTDIFYELRMRLNKRLINLLTSVKLYQDLGKHLIPKFITERKKYQREIEILFSKEYDNKKHYKFMEELRKYTQHAGLAIHITHFNMKTTNAHTNSRLEYSVNFSLNYERLQRDKMFNVTKFPEMEGEIDLKIAVRHYIESISLVHSSIREIFKDQSNNSRELIKKAHTNFKDQFKCDTYYLRAAKIEGSKRMKDIAILLDWDDVRIRLQQKNRKLTRLSDGYISSISKE
ncbi:hypothetical protein [uncultured Draconibacterium sp.]|uniref:hypothetical protein n=1 Tax=uncultured Draconibacterium sp. TaxID=1573823 RepID=UPI002AA7F81E|nr:hypothetical protein [uncultured Draconibacterium sp.]